MEKNETKLTKTLETNINKILKNFGLDNVDVKIYQNNNGKKTYDHVYSEDGKAKSEHFDGDNIPEKDIDKNFKFSKLFYDLNDLKDVRSWFDDSYKFKFEDSIKKVVDRDMDIIKNTYKVKGPEYIDKILEETKKNLINNPFLKTINSFFGTDIDNDIIERECERLKKYIREACKNECTEDSKNEPCDKKQETAGCQSEGGRLATKAESLKANLKRSINEKKAEEDRKKKEAEEKRCKVIDGLKKGVRLCIINRNFQLLKDDLDDPGAGISIQIDNNFLKDVHVYGNFKYDVTKDIVEEVGQKIKDEYEFTGYSVEIIDDTKAKLIFLFN